jgi:hypothetical protein
MEKRVITIVTNIEFEEEKKLVVDGEEIIRGDYYHDKISQMIDGFLMAFDYLGIPYEVTETEEAFD